MTFPIAVFFFVKASWLPKMTADSNASALDSGLDTALAFVENAEGSVCQNYYEKLFSNIVDKTFSGRGSTLAKGKTLMLKMMEVDEATPCVQFLLTKLADKKPKVPPTSLDIIKEGIELFGVKAIPVKDVIKALPAVFNGTNSAARDSAMALSVEIYRWIRQAPLQAMLDGLRTAQKSDFEKIIAEKAESFAASAAVPTLYLRKERPAPGSEAPSAAIGASAAGSTGGAAAGAPGDGGDAREYVDEVDLMKKLKSTDFVTLVADEKWSEQLKGLQLVIDAIGPVPKIKQGNDVHDVIQVIKGFLRQGHLQLQVSSLKILCLLADGMRGSFGSTLRPIMQQIVLKCKEKRLVPEVQAVLQLAFTHCLSYDCINDDVIEFIGSKKSPPHGKVGLMETIVRTFTALPDKVSSDSLKPLATVLVGESEDSDPKVREASVSALAAIGLLAKGRGRLAADAYKVVMATENSVPKVFKKIQAAMEAGPGAAAAGDLGDSLTQKPKASAVEPTTSGAMSSAPAAAKKLGATTGPSGLAKATSSMSATTGSSTTTLKKTSSNSTNSAGAGGAARKGGGAGGSAGAGADDDQAEDLTLSPEEAVLQLEALEVSGWVSGSGLPGMESSKWQEKVEALSAIEKRLLELESSGGSSAQFSAALVKYIASTSSNFKISNINILKATIQTSCAAVKCSGPGGKFSRAAAWELIKNLGDKLSDKKTKDAVQALLSAMGEMIGIGFVVKRMKAVLEKCISPVAHQYYLEWLKEAIAEFGCGAFPVPFIGSFCQAEMENKISSVRTAAVEVMGALHHQIGPRLAAIAFSDDMKPQTKALLEAEFVKVGHDPSAAANAPKASAAAVTAAGGSGGGASAGASAGGIPRQDLCAMVDKNIITELNFVDSKTSWQRRKAAMESIIAACERSGHFLEANKPTGEVVKALKARMSDTQANLKPVAVSAIAHVVASLDSKAAGVKVLQSMAPAMMIGLGDNKKSMRDSTIVALQHAVSGQIPSCGTEVDANLSSFPAADSNMLMAVIPAAAESLVNVVGRQELLSWLLHHIGSLKGDLTELVNPLILTLQDKAAGVRSTGEQLLTALLAHSLTTKVALDKATRDLPPATKRGMQACIDRMMAAHGTAPARPVAVAAVAEVAPTPAPAAARVAEAPPTAPRRQAVPVVHNSSPPSSAPAPAPTSAVVHHEVPTSHMAMPSAKKPTTLAHTPAPHAVAQAPVSATPVRTVMGGSAVAAPTPASASSGNWLLKSNTLGKQRRMQDEIQRLNWPQPPDEPGDAEVAALKVAWRPIISPDLAFVLFPLPRPGCPANQDMYVAAMNELSTQLTCPHLPNHTEFLFRWICIVLCLRQESNPGLLRLLQLVCDLFEALRTVYESGTATLSEAEVSLILPHMIERCGHRSDKHQTLFRYAISLLGALIAPNKFVQSLTQGLKAPNKRSRVICLEEIQRVLEGSGPLSVGTAAVREVVTFLDSRDCDLDGKVAALNLLLAVFLANGKDATKMKKMLGSAASDKALAAVEERIAKHEKAQLDMDQARAEVQEDQFDKEPAVESETFPAENEGEDEQEQLTEEDALNIGAAVEEIRGAQNSDVWALSSSGSSAVLSPASETSHRRMLEQIDSVMASTPLPAKRAATAAKSGVKPPSSRAEPAEAAQVMQSAHSTPLASTPTPVQAPAPASTRSVAEEEGEDTVGALPMEFRSPAPSIRPVSRLSLSASRTAGAPIDEASAAAELEAVYEEVEGKIDALLNIPYVVLASDDVQQDCKDSLKVLHNIVKGDWTAEKLPIDDIMLQARSERLIVLTARCIARAFEIPAMESATSPPANSIPGVDVSLLSISISLLYSLACNAEVTFALSEEALFSVLHEALHRIGDPKITQVALRPDTVGSAEAKETAAQFLRALNSTVLKLAAHSCAGPVLQAMLRIMFCCIPAAELPRYEDHKPLPITSTKAASRLVIQILSEHGNKETAYGEPEVNLRQLLEAIHHFFTRHPTSTSNDTPFRTVKTILNEIVLVRGGHCVLGVLQETAIPQTAFIYLLTCRLGNVQIPQSQAQLDGDLNAKIVAVIDDITSSRDKLGAIKELHRIKQANPQVDINLYLLKISTAFRKYVLNTLAKLDASDDYSENQAVNTNALPPSAAAASADQQSGSTPNKPVGTATYKAETPAASEYASARSTPLTQHSTSSAQSPPYSSGRKQYQQQQQGSHQDESPSTDGASESSPPGSRSRNNSYQQYQQQLQAAQDPASEALRILEGIKNRPHQLAALGDPSGATNNNQRNYSLDYTPKSKTGGAAPSSSAAGLSTPGRLGASGSNYDQAPDGSRDLLSNGKHKRFAFNPETKRMEIIVVDNNDLSPR